MCSVHVIMRFLRMARDCLSVLLRGRGPLALLLGRLSRRRLPVGLDGLDKRVLLLVADDQVDARQSRHTLGIQFRVAAGHDQQSVRLASAGLANHQSRTAIAKMRHRAGIHNIDISGLVKITLNEAGGAHLLADGLAIGLIDLAAQRSDRERCFLLAYLFAHTLWCFLNSGRFVWPDYSAFAQIIKDRPGARLRQQPDWDNL